MTTPAELDALLAALPRNPRVVVSGNASVPWEVLRMFDKAVPEYILQILNAPKGIPDREGVTYESSFVGPGMRKSPRLRYIPTRLSLVPTLYATRLPVDVVIAHTSRVVDGHVSLGVEVNTMVGAIEACKARGGIVIAQVNDQMPYTFGDGEFPVDTFDAMVEVSVPAGAGHPSGELDEAAKQIGALVAERVSDGATLQLGIGAIPDAALGGLLHLRRLGIWSEMFSDGLLDLVERGCLDPGRPVTASFAMGSPELMKWVDRNPQVRMKRVEYTNKPSKIAQQPAMTSINTALQVDLIDQANASRINTRIYSGFGGQTDFLVGALHSPGGQAIMALRSWHPKADVSTIVPLLTEPVTSFQHTVVVTEQGVANMFGHTQHTQAKQMIERAAHPNARDHLRAAATELGLA